MPTGEHHEVPGHVFKNSEAYKQHGERHHVVGGEVHKGAHEKIEAKPNRLAHKVVVDLISKRFRLEPVRRDNSPRKIATKDDFLDHITGEFLDETGAYLTESEEFDGEEITQEEFNEREKKLMDARDKIFNGESLTDEEEDVFVEQFSYFLEDCGYDDVIQPKDVLHNK